MERRSKVATESGVLLLLIAAILVVANVLSFGLYHRFDTTKNERFTLSKGSGRLVRDTLRQQLHVDFYVTRGLAKNEVFIQDVVDLLTSYERESNGKLSYAVIEAKTEEQRKAAKEAGLQEVALGEASETGEDQATIQRGFMGMHFKYGSEAAVLPVLSADQSEGLEFWITSKIREVSAKADETSQKVGVITGKDEIKLSDPNLLRTMPGRGGGPSIKSVIEQALPYYKIEEVDLKDGENAIDKDLSAVIVTQPAKDYTEKELRRIDEFLMQGNKGLVVFASAVNMKANEPSMKGELNTHGLEKLLDGYGVELKKDALYDWGRSFRVPVRTQGGMAAFISTPAIAVAMDDRRVDEKEKFLDTSFDAFFRLDQLAFPFPSSLALHPEKQPGATLRVVARTTAKTTAETGETVELKHSTQWRPKGEYAQRNIAVAVDGKLKSAFAGAGESMGIEVPGESKEPSRILVVSSSHFLTNPFARAGNAPPLPPQMQMFGGIGGDEELQTISDFYTQNLTFTILSLTNTFDWLAGNRDLIATRAKLIGDTNLTYADITAPKAEEGDDEATIQRKVEEYKTARAATQRRVQWTLTLLGPVLFAAYGVFRWKMRENARASISLD